MIDAVKQYLSEIGRRGGKAKTARKTAAVRRNAKKGGWPKGRKRKAKPTGSGTMSPS